MINLVIGLNLLLWLIAFGGFELSMNIVLIKLGGGLMVSLISSYIIFELISSAQVLSHRTILAKKTIAYSLGSLFGFPFVLLIVHLSFKLAS
ncbi:MAG TPA: hypothetical protein VJ795_04130 [Rheinheimera sp.]|uniref:hypothetical protein n=1 Tax=Rheinheimera sp. TaxID=1869214 RepID=UPI002B46B77C|nr:hypothetical protein [Rheinheimera sp.]HJS14238.1 hypothetical protein [Rheinheimera sp.]